MQTHTSSGGPIKTLTLHLSNENTGFSIDATFSVTYKAGSVIKVKLSHLLAGSHHSVQSQQLRNVSKTVVKANK